MDCGVVCLGSQLTGVILRERGTSKHGGVVETRLCTVVSGPSAVIVCLDCRKFSLWNDIALSKGEMCIEQVPCSRWQFGHSCSPAHMAIEAWIWTEALTDMRRPIETRCHVVRYREADGSTLIALHVTAAGVTDSQLASVDPPQVHRPHVTEMERDPLRGRRMR
jgi:hypothetical protein